MTRKFEAVAIVGPYGNIWCNETFDCAELAIAFLEKEFPKHGPGFATIPVVVEISSVIEKEAAFKQPVPVPPALSGKQ